MGTRSAPLGRALRTALVGTAAAAMSAFWMITPATAATAALPACRDHWDYIQPLDANAHWPYGGTAFTTTYCNDINVRPDQDVQVHTCFLPSSGGITCNEWRSIAAGTWGLAATNVKDYTEFYLIFNKTGVTGRVAY